MSFLVVDFGTSNCRASTVSAGGAILSVSRVEHPSGNTGPELDVDLAWATVCAAINAQRATYEVVVDAIAVSCLLAYVFLDSSMQPVGPVLSYADTRAGEQAAVLEGLPDAAQRYRCTGRRARADLALPRMLWLRETDPEAFSRVRHVHGLKDEFVRRLTGQLVTDYAHADYTLCFSPARRAFDSGLISTAGLDRSIFAPPVSAATVVGGLTGQAAGVLNLRAGTPVVAGSSDGTSAMYGCGVLAATAPTVRTGAKPTAAEKAAAGRAVLVCGTTDVLMSESPVFVDDPGRRLTVNSSMVSEGFLVGGATGSSGGALVHIAGMLGVALDQTDVFAQGAGAGAAGVTALVGLTGERAPYWHDAPLVAVTGLSLNHGRGHLVRAVMESCAYRLRRLVLELEAAGRPVGEIVISGGGARSAVWNRIRADVLDRPLLCAIQTEASTLGAAMFARSAVDLRVDLRVLSAEWVRTGQRFNPDPETADAYARGFERFEQLMQESIGREDEGGR